METKCIPIVFCVLLTVYYRKKLALLGTYVMVCLKTILIIKKRIGIIGVVKMYCSALKHLIKTKYGLEPCVNVEKTKCTILYTFKGIKYVISFKRNRKGHAINLITDENGKNVTGDVKKYMGVGDNFHGILTTPQDIGYKTLKFYVIGGDTKVFRESQVIFL